MTARAVDRLVTTLAAGQCGVFARRQALEAGASEGLVRRRRAAGAWVERAQGVYVLPGVPPTWEQSLWIACLASTAAPVISHESAAAVHGLTTFRPGPVVVTVRHSESRLRHLATIHQSRNLPSEHIVVLHGLPVTTVARTIIDLAMVCRRSRLEYVLNDAVSGGKVTDDELIACFDSVARRGRRGSRVLRRLLAGRQPGYVAPASRLEVLLLRVLRSGGLPRPVMQFPLPGRERPEGAVDAAYPDAHLLIEADGRRYHTRNQDFAVDRERDIFSTLAGWRTLRFTWQDLTKRPEWVVECVRRGLRLGAA